MHHPIKEISVNEVQIPRRYVNRIFVHCTASEGAGKHYTGTQLARTIDNWHKARWSTGLGYHFLIDKEGTLIQGRDLRVSPAAQRGHNVGTIAICLHGLIKSKFTQAQLDTLKALCIRLNDLYDSNVTFHGHREVAAKECPVIDYKNILNLDSAGNLGI